jgi:hypothetical protein
LFQEDIDQTIEGRLLILQELERVCVSEGFVVLVAEQLKLDVVVLLDESSQGVVVEQLIVIRVLVEGDFLEVLEGPKIVRDVVD